MFKKYFLFSFLLVVIAGCKPVDNSAALDRTLYGPSIDTGGSPLFTAVRASLTKCQSCHGSWLSLTEAEFVSLGLVVADSPETSKLYYRNQGAASGPGPANMPNGGAVALTADELQGMIDWINSL